jgi:hypothetical protein
MFFLLVSNFENRILESTIFGNDSSGRFLSFSLLCLSITCATDNASLCSYDDSRESKVAFALGIPSLLARHVATGSRLSRSLQWKVTLLYHVWAK